MGGGPGIRVHQFGGQRPRRRPAGAQNDPNEPPRTAFSALQNLLPLILLFILPLLSSLFGSSSDSSSRYPKYSVDVPHPPTYTHHHLSKLGVSYFVDPKVADRYSTADWRTLDKKVEQDLARQLNYECAQEREHKEQMYRDAQGWFSIDQELIRKADGLPMKSCKRMVNLGFGRYI